MATTRIDPHPRPKPATYIAPAWPLAKTYHLPPVVSPPPTRFSEVLENRRSVRRMARPSLRWTVNTIAYASRVQQVLGCPIRLSRRPSPSAGGLHPIDLLVLWPGRRSTLFLYDAAHHLLYKLAVQSSDLLDGLIRRSRDILPEGEGALLILIGDMAKVASAYEHPQSLLWRDAGALLQTLNLTAAAYGQAFCAMGVLGYEVLPAIGAHPQSCALGVAMLGVTLDF